MASTIALALTTIDKNYRLKHDFIDVEHEHHCDSGSDHKIHRVTCGYEEEPTHQDHEPRDDLFFVCAVFEAVK